MILVTGGAGFIGSHLVDRLLAAGEAVTVLDSFDPFYPRGVKERNLEDARRSPGFRLIEGDVRSAADLDRALAGQGARAIVHLAARAGVRPSLEDPVGYADFNVIGTIQVLEAARRHGVRRLLVASSSSVYGNNEKVPFAEDDPVDHPISPYAATKKATELVCHTHAHLYGLSVWCLRFFTVYGPRQRPDLAINKFVRLMAEGEAIPMFGDGSTVRNYTYVDDIVDALVPALDTAGGYEVVNLGGGQTVRLDELIAGIGQAMGVEARIERLPLQPGDVERTVADTAKARRLLGYAPKVDMREGLRRFVAWWRAERARGAT